MNCLRQMILMSFHLALLSLFIFSSLGCDDKNGEGPENTNTDSFGETSTDSETDGTDVTDADVADSTDDTDVPEATDFQKDNICGCLHKAVDNSQSVEWIKQSCVDSISDRCVACVVDETGGNLCEELRAKEIGMAMLQCAGKCPNVITTPDEVAKCEDIIDLYPVDLFLYSLDLKDHYGHCMCTNCLDDFSQCIVNASCILVLSCFMCEKCHKIWFCPDLIKRIPASAIKLAEKVGECAMEHDSCFPAYMLDGGTADSGTL
jgi:hypothetical protein